MATTRTLPATADIDVSSDLFNAGITEDGTPFIGEVYFVQITFADGERLQHVQRWSGVTKHHHEEGVAFVDDRPHATSQAERLAARVRAAGRIDENCWRSVDPAYGSDRYISEGVEAERAYMDRFDD